MESVIFGFLGVVVGALITAGSNYVLVTRQENATAEKERQLDEIEIRRAARLIDADLALGEAVAAVCIENGISFPTDRPLSTDAWRQYRHIMAVRLSTRDWMIVLRGVKAIDDISTASALATKPGATVNPKVAFTNAIVSILNDLKEGRSALAELAHDDYDYDRTGPVRSFSLKAKAEAQEPRTARPIPLTGTVCG